MKKKWICYSMLVVLLCTGLTGCKNGTKEESEAAGTKVQETASEEMIPVEVTLNEVAHSIFYAPMYVAIENGYFAEEGLDLKLVTGFGVRNLVQDGLKKIHVINSAVFLQMNLLNTASPEGPLVFH